MKNDQNKVIKYCSCCGESKEYYISQTKGKKNFFCNLNCHNKWKVGKSVSEEIKAKISKSCSGKNNGMYGKKHSKKTKLEISKKMLSVFTNPDIRYKCGNANRGKIFSQELINKMHDGRTLASYSHPHTEITKRMIGEKSKAKWTAEYKIQHRKRMETLGYYTPLNQKDDYIFYRALSNWIDKMFNTITNSEQLRLLNEVGVFNIYTNKNGVVRDHKFSRKLGFKLGVFPELLRHPMNCQIILHSDNVRNARSNNINDNVIDIKNLFQFIKQYNNVWQEQDICIELIKKYENGNRYNKEEYINEYYK